MQYLNPEFSYPQPDGSWEAVARYPLTKLDTPVSSDDTSILMLSDPEEDTTAYTPYTEVARPIQDVNSTQQSPSTSVDVPALKSLPNREGEFKQGVDSVKMWLQTTSAIARAWCVTMILTGVSMTSNGIASFSSFAAAAMLVLMSPIRKHPKVTSAVLAGIALAFAYMFSPNPIPMSSALRHLADQSANVWKGFPIADSQDVIKGVSPDVVQYQLKSLQKTFIITDQSRPAVLQLSHSQLAMVDLKVLVERSELPYKPALAKEMGYFNEEVARTKKSLLALQAATDMAVDRVTIAANMKLRSITQGSAKSGSMSSLLPSSWSAAREQTRRMMTILTAVSELAETEMHNIIVKVETALEQLDTLLRQRDRVHETTLYGKAETLDEKEKVLSEMWTRVGGNKVKRERFNRNLELLQSLEKNLKSIHAYIIAMKDSLSEASIRLQNQRADIAYLGMMQEQELGNHDWQASAEALKLAVEHLSNISTARMRNGIGIGEYAANLLDG